jgi:hypothetical protein
MYNVSKLTALEKDQLIEWLMFHLDMTTRHKLMADLPQIYLAVVYAQETTLQAVLDEVRATARERNDLQPPNEKD